MTQRQRLRAAKIAIAGDLLWHSTELRNKFGNTAINTIANTLLRQSKFPIGEKVPKDYDRAIYMVLP